MKLGIEMDRLRALWNRFVKSAMSCSHFGKESSGPRLCLSVTVSLTAREFVVQAF